MNASSVIAGMLALQAVGGASMKGLTVEGESLDQRVARCGVTIERGKFTTIRPFIETSENLHGTITLKVVSTSGANSNRSQQIISFPGTAAITVGPASHLDIEMGARVGDVEVCRLVKSVDVDGTIRT